MSHRPAPLIVFGLLLFTAAASAAPLKVVTSFLPLSAAALSIGGDRIALTQLTGETAGPHGFTPSPGDLQTIAQADLLIVNGLGLEEWRFQAFSNTVSSRFVFLDTSEAFKPLIPSPTDASKNGLAGSSVMIVMGPRKAVWTAPGHPTVDDLHRLAEWELANPGADADEPLRQEAAKRLIAFGNDPHLWLDPRFARLQAEAIRDALCRVDPAGAEIYRRNAALYLIELRELDDAFQSFFDKAPQAELITFHDAFSYFCSRYGIHDLGAVEEVLGKEPSPERIDRLTRLISAAHVKVLFAEKGYPSPLLQTLAAQTGAQVAELDPIEVGPPAANAYLERMCSNLAVLQKAWQ